MAESVNESELGRTKQSTSPRDHLEHLINLGWSPDSPLIEKYVITNGLRADLEKILAERSPG